MIIKKALRNWAFENHINIQSVCVCSSGGLCWLRAHRCQYESPAGPRSHWWNRNVWGSASAPSEHRGLLPQTLRESEETDTKEKGIERELECYRNVERNCLDRRWSVLTGSMWNGVKACTSIYFSLTKLNGTCFEELTEREMLWTLIAFSTLPPSTTTTTTWPLHISQC